MFRRKLTALDYHNPDGFDNTGKKTKCAGALKCVSVIWNVQQQGNVQKSGSVTSDSQTFW